MQPSNFMTLSDYQLLVGNAIRLTSGLQNAWITAELSDVRVAGGHCYLELIEKDDQGTTRAKQRAMIWSNVYRVLYHKFMQATGRPIQSGIKVLVCGSANHHPVYGLSFTISDIDPSYTLGDMERLRREILERLTKEGVIGYNRSLPLPVTPQKIAVISAEGAAGYGDFMNQLANNPDGFKVYPLLYNSIMQGERTASSIMEALDRIEMAVDFWDCVVIIRGGGATTDLNGFDDYDLARRIATYPIPVIVGIGHERDRTVLDEIAAVRCKTPTAVAAWITDTLRTAYTNLTDLTDKLTRFASEVLTGEQRRLDSVGLSLPALARQRVLTAKLQLRNMTARMPGALSNLTSKARRRIDYTVNSIGNTAIRNTDLQRNKLKMLSMRMDTASIAVLRRQADNIRRREEMIRILDPLNTLKRGYSITRINGHALTDSEGLAKGSVIETRLANGSIKSEII